MYSIYLLLPILSIDGADVLSGATSFAAKLSDALPQTEETLVFSPLSVHIILSVLSESAGGKTAESLTKALDIPDGLTTAAQYQRELMYINQNKNITIELANKIYVKSSLTVIETLQMLFESFFSTQIENIDFVKSKESADTINGWARKKTHGKIDNVVSEDDFNSFTRSVLISTIYFKASWAKPFDRKRTSNAKFHISATQSVDCKMMVRKDMFFYDHNEELGATFIKLPYKNKRFSMIIGLPNTIAGVNELKTKLISDTNILNNLHRNYIQLSLPKFKIETKIDLTGPLKALGLENIFSDAAYFPNLTYSKEPLSVTKAIQKAIIEVNEEGTEASAVTVADEYPYASTLYYVTVDRPFIYSVVADVDFGNVVLFAGTVVSPAYDE